MQQLRSSLNPWSFVRSWSTKTKTRCKIGYTHYYRNPQPVPAAIFALIAADIRKLITAAQERGIVIRGSDGLGEPEVSDISIRFNGDGSKGHDYETFKFAPETTDFDFCKTAYKPYDLVVTAAMLVIKKHCPAVEISGDGGAEGFLCGLKFASEVLGWEKGISFPYSDGTEDPLIRSERIIPVWQNEHPV